MKKKEKNDKKKRFGVIRTNKKSLGIYNCHNKNPDGSLRLCIEYRGLNKFIYKLIMQSIGLKTLQTHYLKQIYLASQRQCQASIKQQLKRMIFPRRIQPLKMAYMNLLECNLGYTKHRAHFRERWNYIRKELCDFVMVYQTI